ncbi:MAG: alpha/beta hydrolase [Chloroflexi bacterium]|nr:alpha/beta hydrolase [Chloroflexota bacterium]
MEHSQVTPSSAASRRSPWLRRGVLVAGALALGVGIGVVLSIVSAGGWDAWLGARGIVPRYADLGRAAAALDGRRLYLDCRGEGTPTVVLEAGIGTDARSWGAVFPRLAATTRTCAYSRANRWGSDPRGPHTVGDAVRDLRAALANAGEQPPFVLVGHSLGDVYVRVFAGARPGEVAGLVLVDAFAPDQFRRLIAAAPPDLAATWQANLDGNIRAVEATENLRWSESEAELAAVELGDLPVEVVVVPQPFATDPAVPDADRARLEQAWYAELAGVSGRARVTLATGSSHMVHWDRPDLVLEATERLVTLARGG